MARSIQGRIPGWAGGGGRGWRPVRACVYGEWRQWPVYGATFFEANMITAQVQGSKRQTLADEMKTKGQPVRVGVNMEGIHIIDAVKRVRAVWGIGGRR